MAEIHDLCRRARRLSLAFAMIVVTVGAVVAVFVAGVQAQRKMSDVPFDEALLEVYREQVQAIAGVWLVAMVGIVFVTLRTIRVPERMP